MTSVLRSILVLLALQESSVSVNNQREYQGFGEITFELADGTEYTANTVNSSNTAKVIIADADNSSRTIAVTAPDRVLEGKDLTVTFTNNEALNAGESIAVAFFITGPTSLYDADNSDSSPVTFTDARTEESITIKTSDALTTNGMISILVVRGDQYEPASLNPLPITIVAEETLPTVSIRPAGPTSIDEGEDAVFTVSATGATLTETLEVGVTTTQGSGEDFILSPNNPTKTPTLALVSISGTGDVRVETEADTDDETDGTITVTLDASTDVKYLLGTPPDASIVVKDNDDDGSLPNITITGPTSVYEGNDITFMLAADPTLTGDDTITARVQISEEGDFLVTPAKDSPRVVDVVIDNSGGELVLPTITNAMVDENATVRARVISEDTSDGSAATYTIGISPAVAVTVQDNDDPALPNVSIVTASSTPVIEADGAMAVFNVTATLGTNADATPIAVELAISEEGNFLAIGAETARTPVMVTPAVSGSEVAIPHSEAIDNDLVEEPNGKIIAKIVSTSSYSVGTNAMAEVVVQDDEDIPTISIAVPTFEAEGNSATSDYDIAVNLSHATTEEVVVNFALGHRLDSATLDDDYTIGNATRSLTFPPNSTAPQYINIDVVGDTLYEFEERFTITLSLPAGDAVVTLPDEPTATGVIPNDDAKPTVSIADASGLEGDGSSKNTLVFDVTLSAAAGVPVNLVYSTLDGSATAPQTGPADYVKASRQPLQIPASNNSGVTNTTATISIDTVPDDATEIDETFSVSVTLPFGSNAQIGGRSSAIGTIVSDDDPILNIVNTNANNGAIEGSDATFEVRLYGEVTGTVSVRLGNCRWNAFCNS